MKTLAYRAMAMLILALLSALQTFATHLHGQDAWYNYEGNDAYTLYFGFYQDFLSGDDNAIREDEPLYIVIFRGLYVYRTDTLPAESAAAPISGAGPSGCVSGFSPADTRYIRFKGKFSLPADADGYTIKVQRCCMGANVTNLLKPGENGLELQIRIPGSNIAPGAPENSSPRFGPVTRVQECVNSEFKLDFGATDADGDSLVYRLETPFAGGSANNAKPKASSVVSTALTYNRGFSPDHPFGPAGSISLDAKTGRATAFCSNQGNYMIAVACDEYRAGVFLSTIRRNIVIVISNCVYNVKAKIDPDSTSYYSGIPELAKVQCGGNLRVQFSSSSKGAIRHHWDFGDPTTLADTSSEIAPVYVYPNPGRYRVKLRVTGSSCADSQEVDVWLAADSVDQQFDISGGPCQGNDFQVRDRSVLSADMSASYRWQTSAGSFSGAISTIRFGGSGAQQLRGIVVTDSGCVSVLTKTVEVGKLDVHIESDTVVRIKRSLFLRATGAERYVWEPNPFATSLLDGDVLAMYFTDVRTRVPVIVTGSTADGCAATDTAYVSGVLSGYHFLPTAFTPNGDGLNDVLMPMIADYQLVRFNVYNRRGSLIYSTFQPRTGWDGTINGMPQPVDTYYWMLQVRNPYGHIKTESGDVTLVR